MRIVRPDGTTVTRACKAHTRFQAERHVSWSLQAHPLLKAGDVTPGPIGFSLTTDEAARVQAWAGELSAALQDEAIEFPGVDFILSIGPFGEMLEARIGNRCLPIR